MKLQHLCQRFCSKLYLWTTDQLTILPYHRSTIYSIICAQSDRSLRSMMPTNRQLAQQARRNRERNSSILQWQWSAIPASLPVLSSSSYELAIATMATNRQLVQQARRNRERNSIEQQQGSSIPTDLVPAMLASSSHEPMILATTLTVRQLVGQAAHQFRRRHLIHQQLPTNLAAPSPQAQIIATNPVSTNRLQLAQQAR